MKFRKDKWYGSSLLSVSFPSLFALVNSKDLGWKKFRITQLKSENGEA